jgi:5S rRNA maturation endonuclease (ribonuclease M5)
MIDKEYHIRLELIRKGIPYRESRNNFKIRCFDPSCDQGVHKSHPYKLEVTKDGSAAHCWRCDWSGNWNSLARHLGLEPFSNKVDCEILPEDVDPAEFIQKQINACLEFKEEKLPDEIEPWNGEIGNGEDWRGLSVAFLSKIPAYHWHQIDQKGNHVERILFPFYQKNKLLGYTGRRLDDNTVMRYDNADFTRAIKIFFPFDYVKKEFFGTDKLVLVEGPVDSLFLNQFGIPTLSILGTSNWSQSKIDLLITINVRKLLLLMDGDESGRSCAINITNGSEKRNRKFVSLDSVMDKVRVINLPEGKDPASLNQKELIWLKKEFDNL